MTPVSTSTLSSTPPQPVLPVPPKRRAGRRLIGLVALTTLLLGAGLLWHLWSRRLHTEFTATFDGYEQMARAPYEITVPIQRPTARYGFVTVRQVAASNWCGATEGRGLSLAIGEEDLRTEAGQPLTPGQTYRFATAQRFLSRDQTYTLSAR